MSKLLTIYITNYNYGKFIKTAIDSVLSQQDVEFELLIIDDGSTDNSQEVIETYREKDFVTIIYQKNKGLNVTNNVALHLARGKYIMRLDADDYLAPMALKKLSQELDSNDELGLVFPDYYLVDINGKIIEHHKRHDFRKEVTLYDQAAHGACTMIRVDFLRNLGGYNENYKCQDGYELWIKFTSRHKVINVGEPLFYYRQHGSNLTSNENRILGTRAQINADYVQELNINNKAIAIIPVRSKRDLFYNLKMNGTTLLNTKIKQALASQSIMHVIVSSPDKEVKEAIDPQFLENSRCHFHQRSVSLASITTSLSGTIKEALALFSHTLNEVIAVVLLDLRFPLISSVKIDDAVNTMLLFKADSLISVRADNNMYYQHDGSGMKPILNKDGKSRLERDVLYKHVGGITVTHKESFVSNGDVIHGKVGHMVLDKNSAYKIENAQDLDIVANINGLLKLI